MLSSCPSALLIVVRRHRRAGFDPEDRHEVDVLFKNSDVDRRRASVIRSPGDGLGDLVEVTSEANDLP